jgi:AcrR family transcriptional regulator
MPFNPGDQTMRKRFDDNRRKELLDGVMEIITAHGFSKVTIIELAKELHCSGSSLYKIAPNKDSLVMLAITRWGEVALKDFEAQALRGRTAADRARLYFLAGAEAVRPMSHEFRSDVNRFESTRLAYANVSDRFLGRLIELLDEAVKAGEIRPVNTHFLAYTLRQIAYLVRDEELLSDCGLTASQAIQQTQHFIWDGIRIPSIKS